MVLSFCADCVVVCVGGLSVFGCDVSVVGVLVLLFFLAWCFSVSALMWAIHGLSGGRFLPFFWCCACGVCFGVSVVFMVCVGLHVVCLGLS